MVLWYVFPSPEFSTPFCFSRQLPSRTCFCSLSSFRKEGDMGALWGLLEVAAESWKVSPCRRVSQAHCRLVGQPKYSSIARYLSDDPCRTMFVGCKPSLLYPSHFSKNAKSQRVWLSEILCWKSFLANFGAAGKLFPDFPDARNAIPAKVWAFSGKENGCPAFGNPAGFCPPRPPHPS